MIKLERARQIFLSMPVVEEKLHLNIDDYRVKNKIFAEISKNQGWSDLKVGKDEQYLLAKILETYSIPQGGDKGGWIRVRLLKVREEDFADLVWKAWRNTAPPKMVLEY